jgi:hypothetical protein
LLFEPIDSALHFSGLFAGLRPLGDFSINHFIEACYGLLVVVLVCLELGVFLFQALAVAFDLLDVVLEVSELTVPEFDGLAAYLHHFFEVFL